MKNKWNLVFKTKIGRNIAAGRMFILLLTFLSVSGFNVEETRSSSSQQKNNKIRIEISESIKDTRTLDKNFSHERLGKFPQTTQNAIFHTELLTNSSYKEPEVEKAITERLERNPLETTQFPSEKKNSNQTKTSEDNDYTEDFYNAIKPTKAVSVGKLKISKTKIKETGSGEDKGVSMNQSRPLELTKKMSYSRIKRGFGNSSENPTEEAKFVTKTGESKNQLEKNNIGKNFNQIQQSLEKLAKITINDDIKPPVKSTLLNKNFRESREEENRKASPDIQDIITGIVNILNGKTTKPNEGNTGRPPRPTNTRINNRGPPRISDVPPLDFDNPPPYRPLPPPPPPLPPKKIPPPYPFDIPPSMPNIPLPPQPPKPELNKLPSHPFIDGVPIPKIVIPNEQLKKPILNRPPELVLSEYDTISMSEPINSKNTPPMITINTTTVLNHSTVKNLTLKKENIKPTLEATINNNTKILNNNQTEQVTNFTSTKTDHNKIKINGQKISPNSTVKNTNKRVRPNLGTHSSEKPNLNKTTTARPAVKEDKNKTTEIPKIISETVNNKTEASKISSGSDRPLKEEIINGTKKTGEIVESPFKVSVVPNMKPPVTELDTNIRTTESSLKSNITTKGTEKPLQPVIKYNETEKYEIDLELPVLLEPSDGVGEVTPILESSILELSMLPTEPIRLMPTAVTTHRPGQSIITETSHQYKARPGIVLDDPEYKPKGHKRPVITTRPIITAPPPHSHYGEIFDVTVHAVQGPGENSSPGNPFIVSVETPGSQQHKSQVIKGDVSVITKPEDGQNFVSIDGKRTYINLFGEVSSTKINPASTQPPIIGTGYVVPHKETPIHPSNVNKAPISTSPPRKPYKRPSHPPVRIDTCIVGDDTTCDSAQNEMCRTEDGVSSCHCRPGYNRRKHRDTCRRVVSMITSLRVDKLYDRKVKWHNNFQDPDSEEYQQLSYEASQAIESAMSMTPFSDDFINSRINSIYSAQNPENNEPAVYVNITLQLEENFDTVRPAIKQDIQRHLLRVIQRRNNNVGNSAVWVDAPSGSILALQDVDECSSAELQDCHERAVCLNTFGSFKCQCPIGSRDPWVGNVHREGRFCETCPSDYCNNRGECNFEHGQQVCHCSGSFYGGQCEIDGEVLGVAIGASVAAGIIIILTLICLCMWSRRWSREQKSAVGAGMGSPVFGYMATGPTVKTPTIGGPPYQVSIEDRIRWTQIADIMAKSNHYAQPEPVNTTRTSFGGYPTLPSHTMSVKNTLPLPTITPPVPLPRLTLANKQPMGTYGAHSQIGSIHQSSHGIRSSLETTSSSEEEDRADLLGRNFNAPRPKSRASVANQSGIYYDVDFDRSDAYSKQNTIPMNTYTLNPQHQVRPYFR